MQSIRENDFECLASTGVKEHALPMNSIMVLALVSVIAA